MSESARTVEKNPLGSLHGSCDCDGVRGWDFGKVVLVDNVDDLADPSGEYAVSSQPSSKLVMTAGVTLNHIPVPWLVFGEDAYPRIDDKAAVLLESLVRIACDRSAGRTSPTPSSTNSPSRARRDGCSGRCQPRRSPVLAVCPAASCSAPTGQWLAEHRGAAGR